MDWNIFTTIQRIEAKLDRLTRLTFAIGEHLMADLSRLSQDVADETSVVDSVVTLLDGVKQALNDLKASTNDPAVQQQIDQLSSQVEQNKQKLADAVARNTDAQPSS